MTPWGNNYRHSIIQLPIIWNHYWLSVQSSWSHIKTTSERYFNKWVYSKLRPACCVSVKCKLSNLRVQNCTHCELRFNQSVSCELWVHQSCIQNPANMELFVRIVSSMFDWIVNTLLESIISLWVGSRISLHYIKSVLSVYIIPSLHLRQSKSNKVIQWIPISNKNW